MHFILFRNRFLLRLDRGVYAAMQRWADDELRSLNAQVELVLRQALKEAGRMPKQRSAEPAEQKTKS